MTEHDVAQMIAVGKIIWDFLTSPVAQFICAAILAAFFVWTLFKKE